MDSIVPSQNPTIHYTYDAAASGLAAAANSLGHLTQIDNGVTTNDILRYDPLGRITGSSQRTNGATYTFPNGGNSSLICGFSS
jgi:hypothetical protein